MVTLNSCLIWQIISFILPPNEYVCVYASLSGPAIDWQKKIIFSDEAHFHLVGYVNKQNYRIWATENSHAYIEKLTHPKRVTAWCDIIGPVFFENEQGETVTVNGDRYRAMLNQFLFTKIEEEDIGNIWRQQYGATWHTAGSALVVLRPALEIALSATELMSFGHLGAAIWYRWTIICEVPSKISVTPTS